jgi:hypothetical protein
VGARQSNPECSHVLTAGYTCTTAIDATRRWINPAGLDSTTYLGTAGAAALAACLRLLTPSLAKIAAT